MDARIDHVTDSRDARPAFGITYRRYSDTRSSHVRIQADNVDHAMQALTEHIGNTQYAVISVRQEVPQVPAVAKCGPQTRVHSVGGGLTYSFCPQPKGHEGPHTV